VASKFGLDPVYPNSLLLVTYDDRNAKAARLVGIFMTRKTFNSSSINSIGDNFSSNMVAFA
jgi:hypothetical protein